MSWVGVSMVYSLRGWKRDGASRRRSERDCFLVQLLRLVEEVVPRPEPRDEARFLGHGALGRQDPNGHGAARAVIGQSGIVALTAGILATPELLVTTPGLKMAS